MRTQDSNSTKPYLLRAIYEWAEDNGFTPQVLVDAKVEGVEVPENHIVDGQIVLNIGSSAVQLHVMDNECLNFSARFSGIEEEIFLPLDSILAIFARENSQGIFFDSADSGNDPEPNIETSDQPAKKPRKQAKKAAPQSRASHLKIVK